MDGPDLDPWFNALWRKYPEAAVYKQRNGDSLVWTIVTLEAKGTWSDARETARAQSLRSWPVETLEAYMERLRYRLELKAMHEAAVNESAVPLMDLPRTRGEVKLW